MPIIDVLDKKRSSLETIPSLELMLTTTDNPYNPFTEFDLWYNYDVLRGYNTCALLSRIVKASDDLSEEDEQISIQLALEEIIENNITGRHVLVSEKDFFVRDIVD